jgi:hypothetical protein
MTGGAWIRLGYSAKPDVPAGRVCIKLVNYY